MNNQIGLNNDGIIISSNPNSIPATGDKMQILKQNTVAVDCRKRTFVCNQCGFNIPCFCIRDMRKYACPKRAKSRWQEVFFLQDSNFDEYKTFSLPANTDLTCGEKAN